MSTLYSFLACLSIAMQLSGALVLLSAMKSIDQVIRGILNSSGIIITNNHNDKHFNLSLNKVQSALENLYYQKFAFFYILFGYLGAVFFADWSPNGKSQTLLVAFISIILLLFATWITKYISKKLAPKHTTQNIENAPDGTMIISIIPKDDGK